MTTSFQQQNPDEPTPCLEPDQLFDLIEDDGENESALEHIQQCGACAARFATLLETWTLAQQVRLLTSGVDSAPLADQVTEVAVVQQASKHPTFGDTLRSWFRPPRLMAVGVSACGLAIFLLSAALLRGRTARPATPNGEMQAQLEQARRSERHAQESLASAQRQIQARDRQQRDQANHFARQERSLRDRLALLQGKEQVHRQQEIVLNRQIARLRQSHAASGDSLASSAREALQQLAGANADLSGGAVMGGPEPAAGDIELYAPVGVIAPNRRVTFRWQAGPAGTTSMVHIQTPAGDAVLASKPLPTARWSSDLPANTRSVPFYIWYVTASDGKQSRGARFLILDTSRLRAGK